jgi:Uma2 family endonuclease
MSIKTLEPSGSAYKDGNLTYYYESHPTKEDLMGETTRQFKLVEYLISVLRWLYHNEACFITGNLEIYSTPDYLEYPVAPDIMLVKNIALDEEAQDKVTSWKLLEVERPSPTVVFEVGSRDTWKDDLDKKPALYAKIDVKEYFAYDPNVPKLRKKDRTRLYGWKTKDNLAIPLEPNSEGALWSEELNSWLVPEGRYLRLYNKDGKLRLTEAEAENAALEALLAKLKAKGINPDEL